jgi:hypothetical protein
MNIYGIAAIYRFDTTPRTGGDQGISNPRIHLIYSLSATGKLL